MTTADSERASDAALTRCDQLIQWYESEKTRQRVLDSVMQVLVILSSGATVFAASVDLQKWMIVLPAVITTLASGMSTSFRFRTKYVNFAAAAEKLKWAKLRYQLRSARTQGAADEEFVNAMETIVSAELSEWREGLLSGDLARAKPQQT